MEQIRQAIQKVAGEKVEFDLTLPDEQFGDFATNVALQLAAQTGKKPRDVAEDLRVELAEQLKGTVAKVEVAGPGFINFTFADSVFADELKAVDENYGQNELHKDKTVVAEFSDPNPFKVLHVGHLYTSVVGDSIARLFEAAGAKVHRVNFGGDVGLHVAKAMWEIRQKLEGENPEKLKEIPTNERAEWLAEAYVTGSLSYGDDERIDKEIAELNKRIYEIQEKGDKSSPLAQIYWETRQWSYDYFNDFYKKIGVEFEKYYPESETVESGLKAVKEQLSKGVFKESQGAIIFDGDVHNLHTRVFINKEGLPTYETKDIGLVLKKWDDYKFDISLVITGNEQYDYMQVVLKALEQFMPELAQKTIHLTHGMVKPKGGIKMSSRLGNVIKAEDVMNSTAEANQKQSGKDQPEIVLGALKYAFLKHRIGGDIIFDIEESVSLEGNSGPYLQYAHARASSILEKAGLKPAAINEFEADERSLIRKISQYPEVVESAVQELLPSHITTYLYELAQTFNRFYEKNRVIGDQREAIRLNLVKAYAQVLKNGLTLLNIPAPEKM